MAQQAALVTPDYYKPPENKLPLEFYYDLANFREDEQGVPGPTSRSILVRRINWASIRGSATKPRCFWSDPWH